MAKRDIPEINAGSMADIAFLLLIFFLVTTTMDKDTAYIRQIPKKLENVPPPPDIEDRNVCEIKANNANQLLFRGKPLDNPDNISEKIIEFYQMNEDLAESQIEGKISNPGYEGYNYPFYTFISKEDIAANIDREYEDLDKAEEDGNEELIEFHDKAIRDWQEKMKAVRTLGIDVLHEIHAQAHIRIVVQQRTDYELFAKIQSEIEEGLFELRDAASEKYFGESYQTLKTRAAMDKADEKGDRPKLKVLEVLYPGRIIEVRPK